MATATATMRKSLLTLHASTAADVMSANPMSIRDQASVREAVLFLTDRRISAAPVINEAGRPVGVISEADILNYDREHIDHLHPVPEYYLRSELTLSSGEKLPDEFEIEVDDDSKVTDIMTPVIYAVTPETPIESVVAELVSRRIHRLFVVDDDDSLIGVITTLDLLSRLRP
ncbi:MAG: CBS domain-containing protein [Planctomycetes bacterium]|nr:CBS domain-containing protein [Planctomycetota bacterium]